MPPLVPVVDDCRAAHQRLLARCVEFTQEPTERYGSVYANFSDPSGKGWKILEAEHARDACWTSLGGRHPRACLARACGPVPPDPARRRTDVESTGQTEGNT